MEADRVLASEFCIHHSIELSFIQVLSDNGMIVTQVEENVMYLPTSELRLAEKIIHLHFDLDINLEGIETIIHLLGRMEDMQGQIARLTNQLKRYE
jgi:MerR HTH family regulatory protein